MASSSVTKLATGTAKKTTSSGIESEREKVTTISEELVRLEEAREKAERHKEMSDRACCGYIIKCKCERIYQTGPNWPSDPGMCHSCNIERIARNCPVNFRKLVKFIEAASFPYGPEPFNHRGERMDEYVIVRKSHIDKLNETLSSLEQPND